MHALEQLISKSSEMVQRLKREWKLVIVGSGVAAFTIGTALNLVPLYPTEKCSPEAVHCTQNTWTGEYYCLSIDGSKWEWHKRGEILEKCNKNSIGSRFQYPLNCYMREGPAESTHSGECTEDGWKFDIELNEK